MSDEMTDFEKQLSRSLRRVDAPENFAERVIKRAQADSFVAAKQASRVWSLSMPWRWMMSPWPGGAVAALLVAAVFMTGEHVHRERARQVQTQQATQQFEQATQITDRALAHAREAMKRAGVNPDE